MINTVVLKSVSLSLPPQSNMYSIKEQDILLRYSLRVGYHCPASQCQIRAQCYKTNCRCKITEQLQFITQKTEFSKVLCYNFFLSENESIINIIPCADFLYILNCRVKLFQALIPKVTKCSVTLQFFIALAPGWK